MQFPKKGGPFGARVLADIGTGLGAGIAGLSRSLTINGQTVAPTFWYNAADLALASDNWVGEYGETLTAQGSGGVAGLYTPTPRDSDRAVAPGGARYWSAITAAFGDVAIEDIILRIVFRAHTSGLTETILDKFSPGFELFNLSTSIRLSLNDGTSTINISSGAITPGAWYDAMLFVRRAGSAVWYIDGDHSGSPPSVASLGSLTNAEIVNIGARSGGTLPFTGSLALLAMWKANDWLDTHLQAAVAEEQTHRLWGTRSTLFGVPTQSLLRNSAAMLERTKGGVQRSFTVGARWPRMEKRADSAGLYGSGYNSEAQEQNICLQSEDLTTTWALINGTDTIDTTGTESSEYDSVLQGIVADATDTLHGVSQSVTLTAATWYIRGEAKRGDKDWLYVDVSTIANATAYFDLLNGVAGTVGAGAAAKIRDLGDGKMQWEIAVTGTAAAHTVRVCAANADGDNDFAGDGATTNVYAGRISVSLVGGSYIKTTTAAVTRLADAPLDYRGLTLPTRGTIAVDVLMPNRDLGTTTLAGLNDGGAANDRVELLHDATADAANAEVTTGGVAQADVVGTTDLSDGDWHEARMLFGADAVSVAVDGVAEGTPDVAATIPPALDRITVGGGYAGAAAGGLVRLRLFAKPTTKKVTEFT